MDLEEIGINAGNWVDSAQDRDYWRALVNAALNLRVPQAKELVNSVYSVYYYLNCLLGILVQGSNFVLSIYGIFVIYIV